MHDLKICQEEAANVGLTVNWSKTRIMTAEHAEALTSVNINGEDVAVTLSFNYLGSTLSRQGCCEEDIKQRIGKAASVMNSLHKQLWS